MTGGWWNIELSTLGLLSLYLAGRNNHWAWIIGLADEALWIAYAIATRQFAFGASALIYAGLYLHNLRRWREPAKRTPTPYRFTQAMIILLTASIGAWSASLSCSTCHTQRISHIAADGLDQYQALGIGVR